MADANKIRPDVHERFLQILRRERVHHAAHVRFVKQLELRPLTVERDAARFWTCPRCASIYLTRAERAQLLALRVRP